jgi:hypothetical protein
VTRRKFITLLGGAAAIIVIDEHGSCCSRLMYLLGKGDDCARPDLSLYPDG